MKRYNRGQSLLETTILITSVSLGALTFWKLCNDNILLFTERILAVIASPIP